MNRRLKLATGLLVIAVATAVILWNVSAQPAQPALGVTEAKLRAEALAGQEIAVRGTVVEGSILQEDSTVIEFVVADTTEHLRVVFNRTPPDNFGAKEVVVRGQLALDGSVPYLEAHSIQVGCASKY